MSWLQKIPKLSLLILVATYGVFGWLYASWVAELAEQGVFWYQWFLPTVAGTISYAIGLSCILLVIIFFTAPLTLFTLGINNWFKFDAKAFLAIALSIVIFAVIVEHPATFIRILVLSSAAMLFRLDLQTVGCPQKMAQYILIFSSLTIFGLGILTYNLYSN